MSNKDGGPAYPVLIEVTEVDGCRSITRGEDGMSLLDYFAAAALTGLIASNDGEAGDRTEEIPGYAYAIADAMLKERDK